MTRILIIIVIAAAAYLMLTSSGQASTGNSQPSISISAQDCYNHANGIVSPAWSGMNRIQRSVLAMQVIAQCEENRP